jgi:putative membrane protein
MKKTIVIMLSALSFGMMAQSSMTNKEDGKFVTEAAKAGAKEIKLGQMAATKGSTAEVRQLGQTMVDQHTQAAAKLKTIADRKGISLPAEDEECKKCCADLSKKTGKDFDKAYSEMMVKDHKKAIAEFKKEADSGKDADLKSFASSTLPTLQHHLQMSEDACKDSKM